MSRRYTRTASAASAAVQSPSTIQPRVPQPLPPSATWLSSLGVRLSAGHWLDMTVFILVGLIPFAVLGILLGHLLNVDSIGPSIGGITALLSILGGIWFPLTNGVMHELAQALPSYWLVQASHVALGGSGWGTRGWIVDGLWTAVLAVLAVLVSADPSYPSSAPGRDDATMARAFLARSGLTATVVADDPGNAGMCRQLSGQADVVVAGAGGVRPALRDCLVGAGRVVVAFDPLGDLGPAPSAPGQVVSTRRGLVDSVTDLGAWGVRSGALAGRVGVVSEVSADRDVDAAAARLAAQGVDVVERAYVHDDPQTASQDVSQGVLAFQSAGVGTVLFAAPVSVQRQWVAQTGVVAPGTRYVVSDAFDGIVDESYPVTFDGALAHTSLRVPWFQRDHGTTAAQSRCDQVWEANAVPPAYLSAAETVDAYAWCQGFDLLAAGVRDGAPAGSVGPTLRAERISSPLTSDLGPLGGGGYGPTADAVVVWRSSCSCWSEREPFAPR